jgi:hypothetical protein
MEPSHFKDEGKRLGEFQKDFFFFGCSNLGLTETRKVQGFVFTMRLMVFGGYSKKKQGTIGFVLCDRRRSFCFFYFLSQTIKKVKLIMEGSVWSFFLTVVEDDNELKQDG